jgi:hypothetical protein
MLTPDELRKRYPTRKDSSDEELQAFHEALIAFAKLAVDSWRRRRRFEEGGLRVDGRIGVDEVQ